MGGKGKDSGDVGQWQKIKRGERLGVHCSTDGCSSDRLDIRGRVDGFSSGG